MSLGGVAVDAAQKADMWSIIPIILLKPASPTVAIFYEQHRDFYGSDYLAGIMAALATAIICFH